MYLVSSGFSFKPTSSSSSSTQFSQEWARRIVVVKHSIKSNQIDLQFTFFWDRIGLFGFMSATSCTPSPVWQFVYWQFKLDNFWQLIKDICKIQYTNHRISRLVWIFIPVAIFCQIFQPVLGIFWIFTSLFTTSVYIVDLPVYITGYYNVVGIFINLYKAWFRGKVQPHWTTDHWVTGSPPDWS